MRSDTLGLNKAAPHATKRTWKEMQAQELGDKFGRGVQVFRAVLMKRQDMTQTLLVNRYPHFGGVPCLRNQDLSINWYLILKKDNESFTENKNVGPKRN